MLITLLNSFLFNNKNRLPSMASFVASLPQQCPYPALFDTKISPSFSRREPLKYFRSLTIPTTQKLDEWL